MTSGAAYIGPGSVEVVDVAHRPPAAGEVEIRVGYVGLCGTDLHILQGDMDQRVLVPLVFGHEMSGVVSALGPGVAELEVGDLVTVMPLSWDGTCPACMEGNHHICHNLTFIGIDSPGALQTLWNVPAETVVRVPEGVSLREAALIEPIAVAAHDVARSALTTGQRAVVLGAGPIGVLIAIVAGKAGADVVVVEPDGRRRQAVAALGLDVLDPGSDDLAGWVNRWTAGKGADVVFEVSGSAGAARDVTDLVKTRGTIVIVGVHAARREVDLHRVFWRELQVLGARVYTRRDFDDAIDLLVGGAIPVDTLITQVVPLANVGQAMNDLAAGREMKVLVDVQTLSKES